MAETSREAVFEKLQQIFREQFDDPGLTLRPDMTAADVKGWDSHAQINLILECETVFGVRLKTREINTLENVDEMVDHLLRAMARA